MERDAAGARVLDVRPMIAEIAAEIRRGAGVPEIAGRFHATVADMVVNVCCALREETGLNEVALSGGVFQNVLLLGLVQGGLAARGFAVLRHHQVPCNDGGLSLGQAVVAARRDVR